MQKGEVAIPSAAFPISRDPPEGGTLLLRSLASPPSQLFPISRDPPEGGTQRIFEKAPRSVLKVSNF